MEPYKNIHSRVSFFEVGEDFIKLWYRDGTGPYEYTVTGLGKGHIDVMKGLATIGQGLETYIDMYPLVKNGYDREGTTAPQSSPPQKY